MKRALIGLIAVFLIGTLSGKSFAAVEAPTLSYTLDGINLSVSWTTVSGATGYTFYYAPSPYTGPESIAEIDMGSQTTLSADLWEGAAYFMAVTAYIDQEESDYSNIETVSIPYPTAPNPPQLAYDQAGANLSLSWEAVPNANGYTLHYVPSSYTGPETLIPIDLGNNTSFAYSGLIIGQTYTIALSAYNEHGESDLSNIETFTVPEAVTVELSGIIRESMMFSNGEQVVLTGDVQFAEGFILTIANDASLVGNYHSIEIFGSVFITGNAHQLTEVSNTIFKGKGGSLTITYGGVHGGAIFPVFDNSGSLDIANSLVIGPSSALDPPLGTILSGNILSSVNIDASQADPTVIRSNTFINGSSINTISWHDTFRDSYLLVEGNNFLGSGTVLTLNPFFDFQHDVRTSGNYWGSNNITEINERIVDGNDDLNISGIVDISNRASTLTSEAPMQIGKYVVDSSTWLLSQ